MMSLVLRLWKDESAAVAPTIGLALFALIAAGGIAFDYARMAALDTELQNAADQAALAAASQLDGEAGAQTRATSAAQALVTNMTLFANDGDSDGTTITVPTVEFYSTYDPNRADINDPPGTAATGDDDSNYVRITVETRQANFALTPIVAALNSGPITARALAGIGSAICNSPPVLICNPAEPAGNNNSNYAFSIPKGVGLELVSVGGSGGWAPGNFGYLDNYSTANGLPGLRQALGWNTPPGECSPTNGVNTEPGANTPATDALNTRFDIYDTQGCPVGGTCSPAGNVRTDLVRPNVPPGPGNSCRLHNSGWQLPTEYYGKTLPTSLTPLTSAQTATIQTMGHPRDICHALDNSHADHCGQVGTGTWDRNAYFTINHPGLDWMNTAGLGANVTRYETYLWEMANASGPRSVGSNLAHETPICGTPLGAGSSLPDRRRISAAVVNCIAESVNGSAVGVQVVDWVDFFLVEPSLARQRTHQADIYVEVISVTPVGSTGTTGGPTRRDVPRLLE